MPLDWRNPAIDGPIWALDRSGEPAVSSSITPSLVSSTLVSISTPTLTPTPTPTLMTTSAPVATGEPDASHLSLAIVAALGAGGVVFLIAVIACIYLLWRRSTRSTQSIQKDPRPPPPYPVDMLGGFFTKRSSLGKAPIEMAANEVPPTLQKSHELDTEMLAIKS